MSIQSSGSLFFLYAWTNQITETNRGDLPNTVFADAAAAVVGVAGL